MRVTAVLQGLSEGGAVVNCCLNQLSALAAEHQCCLISDSPLLGSDVRFPIQVLPVPRLRWLRGFAHVPRQVIFILMAGVALAFSRQRRSVDVVLVHSHPPTALLAPLLRRRLGCQVVMVMHGDINDRPRGTYDPRITW